MSAVAENFATNPRRKSLFAGLLEASGDLRRAGCLKLYIDGSYVTGKPRPGDYDACWDPTDVAPKLLDPVFLNFANQRAAQKMKYGGEFFPAFFPANNEGYTFLDFFQIERFSGARKGIVLVELATDPMFQSHR